MLVTLVVRSFKTRIKNLRIRVNFCRYLHALIETYALVEKSKNVKRNHGRYVLHYAGFVHNSMINRNWFVYNFGIGPFKNNCKLHSLYIVISASDLWSHMTDFECQSVCFFSFGRRSKQSFFCIRKKNVYIWKWIHSFCEEHRNWKLRHRHHMMPYQQILTKNHKKKTTRKIKARW